MATDDRPVYLRLREEIAGSIIDGRFREGDALPSVRALALKNKANPLTVAKAYQSFQANGHVIVRRGVGMFVADGARSKLQAEERDHFLQDEWPRIRAKISLLSLDVADLIDPTLV